MRVLQAGDSFGESALRLGVHKRLMSVKAQCDVKCLALGRDVLNRILGDKVEVIIYKNISRWSFERIEGFHSLNKLQRDQFLDKLVITHHSNNEIIVQKGTQLAKNIIIVLEGRVTVRRGQAIIN